MQSAKDSNNTHIVYVVDETGIAEVFTTLKEYLAHPNLPMLSLLYYSQSGRFVFEKELEILQKHFPSRFFVSFETSALEEHRICGQPSLEAVINANTLPEMRFIVSGQASFTDRIRELLHFLSMEDVEVKCTSYLT